jgi:glucokinase
MDQGFERSVLVYDVGGSHVSCAVCSSKSLRLGPIARESYPAQNSSSAFLDMLERLGKEASTSFDGVLGAELAFPGPFDFSAGISLMRHKLVYLYGIDLRGAIAGRFGWNGEQVRFVHDAAAFLLGEMGGGAARSVHRAVGITLGTGVGSAFSIDGRVVNNGEGVPPGGEIWNLGFLSGTVEDSVSSRAIRQSYRQRTGREVEVDALARAAAHDPNAREAFVEFGHHLGLAMRATLSRFDPQVVVLGGGICGASELFLPYALREVEGLALEIRITQLFDRAPLVGAAVAWFNSSHVVHGQVSQ